MAEGPECALVPRRTQVTRRDHSREVPGTEEVDAVAPAPADLTQELGAPLEDSACLQSPERPPRCPQSPMKPWWSSSRTGRRSPPRCSRTRSASRYRPSRRRVVSSDLTEIQPSDRRADVIVVLLVGEQQRPAMAIVVEVQLGADPEKPYSWPVYVTQTRARHRCPTRLLVVTIDADIARWCARPIDTGHPGWTLTPLVLGPEGVPVVTDAAQATAAPEVVVLSAMAHGRGESAEAIGVAFLAAAAGLDEERRAVYGDLAPSSLNAAARRTADVGGDHEERLRVSERIRAQLRGEGPGRGTEGRAPRGQGAGRARLPGGPRAGDPCRGPGARPREHGPRRAGPLDPPRCLRRRRQGAARDGRLLSAHGRGNDRAAEARPRADVVARGNHPSSPPPAHRPDRELRKPPAAARPAAARELGRGT
ncbi:uncharacterized protein SOCEGT47_063770 [Sorangium cellulosum]|uniref:Uncharacterized protein n=1 Tax=Sorangium cellulosum TaxID=56 RepID=A0A4P2Q8F9_SORCE|nr:uncharacterized protein SOCEGT47_063770 [Sorangium cellulosum]